VTASPKARVVNPLCSRHHRRGRIGWVVAGSPAAGPLSAALSVAPRSSRQPRTASPAGSCWDLRWV